MSVVVYHLIVENTMDEKALLAVQNKISGQNAMMQALKEKAEEYGIM